MQLKIRQIRQEKLRVLVGSFVFVNRVYQVKSFLFQLYFEETSNEEKTLVKTQKAKFPRHPIIIPAPLRVLSYTGGNSDSAADADRMELLVLFTI